ncbi:MAG: PAS domain-containing protein [Spirosomataceae bacterium]
MTFYSNFQPSGVQMLTTPLLCWDLAHPLLPKRINIANDIRKIDELKNKFRWQFDYPLRSYLEENYSIVVTNSEREVIWLSHNFFSLTGYTIEDIQGNKPSILQGEKTSKKIKQKIRDSLRKLEKFKVQVLNYRKDGKEYKCCVEVFPIFTVDGLCTHFLAFEKEV